MAETQNIQALARELGIERRLLYCWRDACASGGEVGLRRAGRPGTVDRAEAALAVVDGTGGAAPPERRIADLERKIGEQQVALDYFRIALRHVRGRRRTSGAPGGTVSAP